MIGLKGFYKTMEKVWELKNNANNQILANPPL